MKKSHTYVLSTSSTHRTRTPKTPSTVTYTADQAHKGPSTPSTLLHQRPRKSPPGPRSFRGLDRDPSPAKSRTYAGFPSISALGLWSSLLAYQKDHNLHTGHTIEKTYLKTHAGLTHAHTYVRTISSVAVICSGGHARNKYLTLVPNLGHPRPLPLAMPGPASKAPTGVPSKAMPVTPSKGGSGKGKGKHRSAESAAQGSQPRSSGSQPSSSGSQPTSSAAQKRVQGVSVWDIVQVQAPHEGPAQLKLPPWWPKDDGRGKTRTYRRRGG